MIQERVGNGYVTQMETTGILVLMPMEVKIMHNMILLNVVQLMKMVMVNVVRKMK